MKFKLTKKKTAGIILALALSSSFAVPQYAACYTPMDERIDVKGDAGDLLNYSFISLNDLNYDNKYKGGAAIRITGQGTVNYIADCLFQNCRSDMHSGGAIYNANAIKGGIYNCIFDANGIWESAYVRNTVFYGIAVYNAEGASLSYISDSTFSGNHTIAESFMPGLGSGVEYGGAVYNGGSISYISNCDFKDNYLYDNRLGGGSNVYGGAIANGENGVIDGHGSPFTPIDNCSFTGNYVYTYHGTAYGGAIWNAGTIGPYGISAAFTDNYAETGDRGKFGRAHDAYGGAIYNSGTIDGGLRADFTDNHVYVGIGLTRSYSAVSEGGAVYNSGAIDSITGSFEHNYALIANGFYIVDGYAAGGAVYNSGSIESIEGDFTYNIARVKHEDSYDSKAWAEGGAVYNSGSIESIEGGFSTNHAYGDIYSYGGAIYNTGSIGKLTGPFVGNTAESLNSPSAHDYGGAIYNTGSLGEISESSFTDNSAKEGWGGAIYNTGDIDAVKDTDFSGNNSTEAGGAVYNAENIGEISGGTFSLSSANAGGAIYNSEDASINGGAIALGDVTDNYVSGATGASGGAIYDQTSKVLTMAGDVSGNQAKTTEGYAWGGAAYLTSEGSVITVTGSVTGNAAISEEGSAWGGAFFNKTGDTLVIEGSTIEGNYVESYGNAYGGAVYNNGEFYLEDDVTLSGNYAVSETGEAAGGAIYNTGTISDGGALNLGTLSGNYVEGATAAKGGAIYDTISTEVNLDGDVSDNYAKVTGSGDVKGGVIYLEKASDEATTVTVSGNVTGNHAETADGSAYGGAFYAYGSDTINIEGGTISGNYVTATENAIGGAIYNAGTLNINDSSVELSGNYAVSTEGYAFGGGIYNKGSLDGGLISLGDVKDNYVSGATGASGGAIYDSSSTMLTIAGDIEGNQAKTASGYAWGGAAYLASEGSIITVTGDVTGNSAVSEDGSAWGGAFFNKSADTLIITGNLTGNYAEATENAYGGAVYNSGDFYVIEGAELTDNHVTAENGTAAGGAIYNAGVITGGELVLGSISGNWAESENGEAKGGAIYDKTSTDVTVTGDVTDNYVKAGSGDVYGGVIYLEKADDGATSITVEGNISGNHAETASGSAYGGAFYNNGEATLTAGGDITGNYAVSTDGNAYGGAVYNEGQFNIEENPDITGNYAVSENGEAAGGAIYNTGSINGGSTLNLGDVTDNYAEGAVSAKGGAIYDAVSTEINITGRVADNYVKTESGDVYGGVFYLEKASDGATSITVNGSVKGNHADTESGSAYGGAFYNNGEATLSVSGSVTGNYAVSTEGDAKGGAIYNEGTVNIDAGGSLMISGNYAESTEGEAKGGAIYNAAGGTVNITADGGYVSIAGNYATDGDTEESSFLYGEKGSVINFDMTDSNIYLEDDMYGETGYEVNITGNGSDSNTFGFYGDMEEANLAVSGITLDTADYVTHVYNVNKLTIAGDTAMRPDVDLAAGEMDRFTAAEYGSHTGTLTVTDVNLISDADEKTVNIFFAEEGLKDAVNAASGLKGYTDLYRYKVDYDNRSDGGYFGFTKAGNNPAVLVSSVAQAGLFGAASMMYGYAFEHSEYYAALPRAEKYTEEDGECVYSCNSLTEGGVWVRPFSSNETIGFNDLRVKDKYRGALIGIDSDVKDCGNGWAGVLTVYGGYEHISQSYEESGVRQRGGFGGITGTFYKSGFYTAVTAMAGGTTAHGSTSAGHEKEHLESYGLAARAGWNLEYAGGKYSFLPSFTAGYTNVKAKSYTNAQDFRIDPKSMSGIQLNPNVKWVMNMKKGLRPYLTAGEVWTVAQSSGATADGTELERLYFHPYTEYGLGVTKMWGSCDGYAQVLGHAGSRRGVLFNLGFRWSF